MDRLVNHHLDIDMHMPKYENCGNYQKFGTQCSKIILQIGTLLLVTEILPCYTSFLELETQPQWWTVSIHGGDGNAWKVYSRCCGLDRTQPLLLWQDFWPTLKWLFLFGLIEEEPSLPKVFDYEKDRFENDMNYYFPGGVAKFILGWSGCCASLLFGSLLEPICLMKNDLILLLYHTCVSSRWVA